jgi:hypothetical protein
MRIEPNWTPLDKLIREMGANPRPRTLNVVPLDEMKEIEILLKQGIEVKLDEVEVRQGFLGYKENLIILYIDDNTHQTEFVLRDSPQEGRKFHIFDCSTLQRMRSEGRFERYVVTTKSDGFFKVKVMRNKNDDFIVEMAAQLLVCQHCLEEIGYFNPNRSRGVKRSHIVREFSIKDFFDTYTPKFKNLPDRKVN